MEKKVLTLTVSKQWFDMIAAGDKIEEYREIKPYWIVRLYETFRQEPMQYIARAIEGRVDWLKMYIRCNQFILKPYTHVLFINGYGNDKPRVEKEIESISIGKPKKGWCPDEFLDKEYFVIKFQ